MGAIIGVAGLNNWIVPANPPKERAVAPNFEQFDGLDPLHQPTGKDPGSRPGGGQTPKASQTYTPGPLTSTTGTVGGQPLPTGDLLHRPPGSSTPAYPINMQFRSGVGQNYQGVAQTVALGGITNNPPVPGDLSMIIAGVG